MARTGRGRTPEPPARRRHCGAGYLARPVPRACAPRCGAAWPGQATSAIGHDRTGPETMARTGRGRTPGLPAHDASIALRVACPGGRPGRVRLDAARLDVPRPRPQSATTRTALRTWPGPGPVAYHVHQRTTPALRGASCAARPAPGARPPRCGPARCAQAAPAIGHDRNGSEKAAVKARNAPIIQPGPWSQDASWWQPEPCFRRWTAQNAKTAKEAQDLARSCSACASAQRGDPGASRPASSAPGARAPRCGSPRGAQAAPAIGHDRNGAERLPKPRPGRAPRPPAHDAGNAARAARRGPRPERVRLSLRSG